MLEIIKILSIMLIIILLIIQYTFIFVDLFYDYSKWENGRNIKTKKSLLLHIIPFHFAVTRILPNIFYPIKNLIRNIKELK